MIGYLGSKSRQLAALACLVLAISAPMGIAAAQTIQEFPVPTVGSSPTDITTGPDGALWLNGTASPWGAAASPEGRW
jgi:streptogramin lyase